MFVWACMRCLVNLDNMDLNYSEKFEIDKNTDCGKVVSPKKNYLSFFLKLFLHKWHADLHGFANF